MKYTTIRQTFITGSIAAIFLAAASSAPAALLFTPSYSGSVYHTHSNSDAVIGFDWGSDGKMYYAAGRSDYKFGGFYRKDAGSSTGLVATNSNLYSGESVVAIGSSIYYNDSDNSSQFIRRYDIGSGTIASTTATNYALGTDGTNLFTTGSADYITTDILYYANGNLGTASNNLGGVAGSSGPVAIDAAGNLFYAPGYGDKSIYRWSFSEVVAARSGGPQLSATGHLFANYSSAFAAMSGASSMAIDAAGSLFVTLTSYSDPSNLVRFNASGTTNEVVATSGDRLGGLDIHDGQLYVASGNEVFSVIPEPSALPLSLFAIVPFVARRRRSSK